MKKLKNTLLYVVGFLALCLLIKYTIPLYNGSQLEKRLLNTSYARQQLYKDLNLTEDQKVLLEENKNKNREQMKALFQDMHEKMALIRQELQKDQLDMVKIDQINTELKQLQARMFDYRLQSILEVRKILTPEQFRKFSSKMEERPSHFRNKRERPE